MIDIHTHILPSVDDGSSSLEMSIEMIKLELNQGVTDIIFTPHTQFHNEFNEKEKLLSVYYEFIGELNKRNIIGNFYLGSEIYFDKNTINHFKNNELLSLNNSKYVLIEFDFESKFNYISESLYSISLLGYIPIVAHVERYQLSFSEIVKLKKEGNLLQWNANFISGGLLKKHYVNKLLKNHLIDYIASDCHSMNNRIPNLYLVEKILNSQPNININRFTNTNERN